MYYKTKVNLNNKKRGEYIKTPMFDKKGKTIYNPFLELKILTKRYNDIIVCINSFHI